MSSTIQVLTSQSMGISVHCYLLQTGAGFFLIDTGLAKAYAHLERDLELAGCRPGDLKLVILTHGDLDHSGNSVRLRERYGAKIGMHHGDLANVQSGDMFVNKQVNPIAKSLARLLFFVTGMARFDRFTPDLFFEDGQDLSGLGLDATVIHLPGHSKGSLGILTAQGDLFCGDLLENTRKPAVNALGDDRAQMQASTEKLTGLRIKTIYPGHGSPFASEALFGKHAAQTLKA
jgi:hydroxyacylglutathione hydrolase